MKTTGFRSIVLYILLFAFLGGLGYFLVNLVLNGDKWAMQPYNGHIYAGNSTVTLGEIRDRNDNLLASTVDGARVYSDDETVRRALMHTVGDTAGYISTSVQYTMRSKLAGYNLIFGLNDTIFNKLGNNIDLTVDQNACVAAYNAMGENNGAAIAYNYKTGEILCKVSKPTFDPSNPPEDLAENEEAYEGVYLDNTLSGSFTPGSIFKVVTAAAAMERWPDSWQSITYDCAGTAEIGGDSITCLHGDAHGTQDMYSAMGNSCNIFFAHLANDLGKEALEEKAEEMGFNKEFHLGSVPISESTIDLSNANTNELGWASVGQYTVLANPYHMMVLMGAIAGGGSYVQPKLTTGSDLLGDLTQGDSRQLVTSTEASQLKSLLRSDVENYYGDWLFPEGMNVCAKTGTGEVGEGKAPNCWMVGFCDSDTYPIAFAVLVEEGTGGIESAGTVAAAMLSALA
jgi:peptidoglycan glycosyltransferase